MGAVRDAPSMFWNRIPRPRRGNRGAPTRLRVDLDPFAVLHNSPVLARAEIRRASQK